jgi:dihydropteroate synthase/2-amino-4-hydroxy-6-hydroxymethyldihydropteridine diphosphokinase
MPAVPTALYRYCIALGGNVGTRIQTLTSALSSLKRIGHIERTSRLYETEPLYQSAQPAFLNAVIVLQTDRAPDALLLDLERIEREHGREDKHVSGERYGPRTLDLDILLAERWQEDRFRALSPLQTPRLTIPHPRMAERAFVLYPLRDVGVEVAGARPLPGRVQQVIVSASEMSLPVRRPAPALPHVMGVLNITPDSFSDGREDYRSIESALERAQRLIGHGARLLDLGGQSTRPGAKSISPEEEAARVVPVIRALRARYPPREGIWISVDTFYASVAAAAVQHGADCINDVSGGTLDPAMLPLLAMLQVPTILMHMRGNPQTMMDMAAYPQGKLVETVAAELQGRLSAAEKAGVYRWNLIADPGFGFAKIGSQNVELLSQLEAFQKMLDEESGAWPLVVGVSRKRFLEPFVARAAGEDASPSSGAPVEPMRDAAGRDFATAGAVTWAALHGADIVRVHDPAVCDAVRCFLQLQASSEMPQLEPASSTTRSGIL